MTAPSQFFEVQEVGDDVSAHDMVNMDDDAFAKMMGFVPNEAGTPEAESPVPLPEEPEQAEEVEEVEEVEEPEQVPDEDADQDTEADAVAKKPEEAEETPEEEPKEDEEKKPLTAYVVRQGEDEVEIPEGVTLTFKANGKERENVPLEKVVLMAQMGYYNQDREEQVTAAKRFVGEAQNQIAEQREVIEQLTSQYDRLLTDPDFLERAIEAYAQQTSPEMRAQRAEAALRQQSQNQTQQSVRKDAETYVVTQIYPAVSQVLSDFATVNEYEVMGKFNELVFPFIENGTVHPSKLEDVKRVVSTDLRNWAQQLHFDRDGQVKTVEANKKAERTKLALAKKQIARAQKPVESKAAPSKNKAQKFETVDDWMNTMFPSS